MNAFQPGGPQRFRHQRRGLAKMIATQGVTALLFDPGLGKTAVVLDYAALLALKATSGEVRVLVVCPLAAVDTWVLQCEKFMSLQVNYWAETLGGSIEQRGEALAFRGGRPKKTAMGNPRDAFRAQGWKRSPALAFRASGPMSAREGPEGLGTDKPRVVIEIINFDTLASRARHGSQTMADFMVDAIRRYGPELIVVDESHRIKSATSNTSRCLLRVGEFVARRIILTGTVMPRSPLDVYGQWRFLDPYAFGSLNRDGTRRQSTITSFRDRFATMGGFMGREVKGFVNLDDMQRIMAVNAVVARKADALDLPPTTDVIVPVDLSPAEQRAYGEMKSQLQAQLDNGSTSTVMSLLTQMMRLRQITSGHLPDDAGQVHEVGRSKAQVIRSIVNDTLLGESRVVVFCLFTREIAMLCDLLAEPGTTILRVEGSTPTSQRIAMRQRFGSDDPSRIVMVAQVRTMSLAVNELVTANHAVFGSLSQQRDDLEQAKARLDRQGQTQPVTFWFCLAPHTVDEVIYKVHQERGDLETAMLEHIRGINV